VLTDIQEVLEGVNMAVEVWFFGFLGPVEAKLNSFQIELLGSMNYYGQVAFSSILFHGCCFVAYNVWGLG
jgi:hypothetical protein